MKTKHFVITVICLALMFPFITNAQGITSSKNKNVMSVWKPVKLNEGATEKNKINVKNGVEFFHKREVCNSDTVIFLKAVNSNKFPVTITWQEGVGVTKTITVAASSEVEGKCVSTDTNENQMKVSKQGINKTNKFNLVKTLSVTEVKN